MNADDNFWKRKLAAFLHDPPHKPFRIASHEDERKSYWTEAGLDEGEFRELFDRLDDHWAAAADRMIFPDWRPSGVRTDWPEDAQCAFHHPMGGGGRVTLRDAGAIPTTAKAEEILHSSLQRCGLKDTEDWMTRWWKTWRLWPETSARNHPLLGYLAADTRVPHHTLWHHNGLVAGLSTCDSGCSFLMFQIGPVQDFIKQARSTRDLWAGSFLLSYLISRALFAVAREIGPESIIYPQLRGVSLIDWFGFQAEGQFWNEALHATHQRDGVRDELLTPNLPNRFLALVPKGWRGRGEETIGGVAEKAVRDAWREVADKVRSAIHESLGKSFEGWDDFWKAQTDRFPVVDYVLHDWDTTEKVLKEAETNTPPLHGGWEQHPLKQAVVWATQKIPDGHRDDRCYPLNPGFAWALHYAATEWRFAAAKNARAFPSWRKTGGRDDGGPGNVDKDHLDGRSEVLGGHQHEAFWNAMRSAHWGDNVPTTLFKGRQEYGALTTIKRLFPFVWMRHALDTAAPKFDSTIDIAQESSNESSNAYYAVLCMDGDDMGK